MYNVWFKSPTESAIAGKYPIIPTPNLDGSPSSESETISSLLSLNTAGLKNDYEAARSKADRLKLLAKMGSAEKKAKAAEAVEEADRLGVQLEEARAKSKEIVDAEKARQLEIRREQVRVAYNP